VAASARRFGSFTRQTERKSWKSCDQREGEGEDEEEEGREGGGEASMGGGLEGMRKIARLRREGRREGGGKKVS